MVIFRSLQLLLCWLNTHQKYLCSDELERVCLCGGLIIWCPNIERDVLHTKHSLSDISAQGSAVWWSAGHNSSHYYSKQESPLTDTWGS